MRVTYRSLPGRGLKGPVAVYEQVGPVSFCCADMCREWGLLIGFGIKGHPRTTSREVNLQTLHPQSSGSIVQGITEIRCCPWCGQEVEVCRVK
jgi:hypothetical protein